VRLCVPRKCQNIPTKNSTFYQLEGKNEKNFKFYLLPSPLPYFLF
jgi:hypothetical protein